MNKKFFAAAVVAALFAAPAMAAVTFDAATGTGFVGKGDVQLVYGWNNSTLQRNAAAVQFRAQSSVVMAQTWECTNSKNEKIQERERTMTTSVGGVVSTIARDSKHQVTGFNLMGYAATGSTSTTTTEGPKLNSCPDESGNWTLTTPAGDPELVSEESSGGLEVSTDGTTWTPLSGN